MQVIKQKARPTKPYTTQTWCFVVLNIEEFLSPDLNSRFVAVNGVKIPYGEVCRRNREKDWARFNEEVA